MDICTKGISHKAADHRDITKAFLSMTELQQHRDICKEAIQRDKIWAFLQEGAIT
jgi:hypothetical protein